MERKQKTRKAIEVLYDAFVGFEKVDYFGIDLDITRYDKTLSVHGVEHIFYLSDGNLIKFTESWASM